MHCCDACGRIYAPTRAPETCPECRGPLVARGAREATALAAARRRRLWTAAQQARLLELDRRDGARPF